MTPERYHVFLSHNSQDKPAIEELARRLEDAGLHCWLDKWRLVPGGQWQPEMAQGLAESDSCAVFVGPSGLGPWEEREVNAAISLQVKSRRLRVIPVTLPGARPEQLQNLPLFLQGNTWVEFPTLDDTAPEFQNAFYRLKCGILGLQPGPGHSHEIDEGVCPYRGLDVFKPEHAKFFFGRRVLVERLLDVLRIRIDANQPQSRLVAVVGASGAGKSSLVLAGLVPELEKGRLGGSERWPILVFRPGSDPLESMEVGLGSHPDFRSTYGDVENVARQLEGGRQKRLHLAVRLAMQNRPDADRAVIVVDQFEELFTHCQSGTQRTELIENLLSAAGAVGGRALVVLTLRADFYGHCASHSAFADVLSQSHVLVGPIASNEELREIIEQPAWLVGLECEPGLVEMLIQDMRRQPNALPLLEHALRMLWERREGRRLTVSAYRAIGELEGALRQHADSLFQSLSAEEKAACRRVFERLVKPGEGVHDARRRASLPEFSPHEQAILRRLVDERLVATEGKPDAANVEVEVTHEALIDAWPRLREWIDEDREAILFRIRLTEAARDWDRHGRPCDSEYVHSGSRLIRAQAWLDAQPEQTSALNLEREFIQAGFKLRRNYRLRRLAKTSVVAFLFLAVLGLVWWFAAGQLNRQRAESLVGRLLVAKDEQVKSILDEMRNYQGLTEELLKKELQRIPVDSDQRLLVSLALLPADPSQAEFLREQLLVAKPTLFDLIVGKLEAHKPALIEGLWAVLKDRRNDSDRRLRAAGALATYDPNNAKWGPVTRDVARTVVCADPTFLEPWVAAFRPVSNRLLVPLGELFRDPQLDPLQRSVATALLAVYAKDDCGRLVDLLCDATEGQFPTIFSALRPFEDDAIRRLENILNQKPDPQTKPVSAIDDPKERLAKRKANAATALAKINRQQVVWPLLRPDGDPRLRSYLIHRLAHVGGSADEIERQLSIQKDVFIRRSLLLCLGEYDEVQLPLEKRRELLTDLFRIFEADPDSGVHSAAEWVLRRWGHESDLANRTEALRGLSEGDRRWYVTNEGQTMLVVPGRDKFQMGSPASEADRKDWPDDIAERSHERSIPRTFAIAATEVTIEQFDRFRQSEDYREYEPFAKADDAVRGRYALDAQSTCPITVTWYEAAAYCNWLSKRDNHRTKGERCYPTAAETFKDGMVMPEGYLQRPGYRLPTEAEWEYACRANAATSRYFGETDELLEKYAWYRKNTFERGMHPVGTLKPNDFGLFDMLGNASEWCQSKLQPYPKTAAEPVQDIEEPDPIADRDERVLRGAAYVSVPAKLRSAMRLGSAPNERGTLSFRVARTLELFSPNPD